MNLRIAISGSACTGKSTLAQALATTLGLPLIPEAMRLHLEAGNPRLDTLPAEQAGAVLKHFQHDLRVKESHSETFVADNGALDLEAYACWYGCDLPWEPWEQRYDAIVLLPAGVLPYEADGVRHPDPRAEARFQALVERLAMERDLGPRLLSMPADKLTVADRVDWVLERLRAGVLQAR